MDNYLDPISFCIEFAELSDLINSVCGAIVTILEYSIQSNEKKSAHEDKTTEEIFIDTIDQNEEKSFSTSFSESIKIVRRKIGVSLSKCIHCNLIKMFLSDRF